MSKYLSGNIPWNKGLKGFRAGEKRKPHSIETKLKIKVAMTGKQLGHSVSEITRNKIREKHLGKKCPAITGDKSHFWKGGISTYDRKLYLNNKRRARKKGAEGFHTQGEWELLKKQYGYRCPCCKEKEPKIRLTEDHIIPLDKGGSNYIENIQPLCKSCNSRKHTKIIKFKICEKSYQL